MKCGGCGAENPVEARFCLKCGSSLDGSPQDSQHPRPVSEFVALQAQSSVSKMLETPGTALLTLGVLLLIIAIIIGALEHWASAIALFVISVVLIYFAVQLRGHEAKVAAAQATRIEVREREIVKVKCRYCGALNPDGATNCGSCGAQL